MPSPKWEVFFVYDSSNTPRTGVAGGMSFLTYKDSSGTNLAQPTIQEIGGGAYRFLPVFADPTKGIVYVIDTGTGSSPDRVARFIRPEDWHTDDISILKTVATGKWRIHTSGPEANRLVFYDVDGTTVLYRFDLTDSAGFPTTTNPFQRTPV